MIIGANSGSAIGTLVERTSGFVMLLHLPGDHTAATVADAMAKAVPKTPEVLRRSLTWDQGSEMALHTKITEATGLPIYFCDPPADLLLRSSQPVAARQQREHQRSAAPVLSQGHRSVVPRPGDPRQRRRRTQRPPLQTPRLAHPSRGTRPTTIEPVRFRCSDRLNPRGGRCIHIPHSRISHTVDARRCATFRARSGSRCAWWRCRGTAANGRPGGSGGSTPARTDASRP